MILTILSLLIIASYTVAVCIKTKGIPYSISATYYSLDHKLIFGACMTCTAMFLFPVVWEYSTSFIMQLLSVAACIGLIGVGLAPDFKDGWINKIHCGSAALTLMASQLWVGIIGGWDILAIAWSAFITYTIVYMVRHRSGKLIDRFIRTRPMFWCEITALVALYVRLFLKLT